MDLSLRWRAAEDLFHPGSFVGVTGQAFVSSVDRARLLCGEGQAGLAGQSGGALLPDALEHELSGVRVLLQNAIVCCAMTQTSATATIRGPDRTDSLAVRVAAAGLEIGE